MKKVLLKALVLLLALPLVFTHQSASAAEATPDSIVKLAKQMQGVPYKWGGTTPKGFDCSGFLTYVYSEHGVKLPRTTADQYKTGESVSKGELLPGDIVFFTTYKPGASHAGIYTGDNKFIHADSDDGIMINSMDMSYYKSRYIGAKRVVPQESVKGMAAAVPVKQGQIGMVYVKKKINLWQRTENNKLKMVRILNPGEKYRVYNYDTLFGGQYNLGSQLYITNMESYIEYVPVGQ
ncbi:endopeptidase [Paenibacillus sp. FSL R5-0490]|uniref:C40 family peptidase n=1 Tax=Bacillales TaxID=1385 RepID=UPI00096C1FF6|nr:C40 family peptidase [Paenibacillus sp. FSL R5-0490]OMF61516.1 endopeptidase [Paenibacillus sp. FSL R5-0490]